MKMVKKESLNMGSSKSGSYNQTSSGGSINSIRNYTPKVTRPDALVKKPKKVNVNKVKKTKTRPWPFSGQSVENT